MNYTRQEKDPTSRAIGTAVVLLIHAGVIYALATGLGKGVVEVIKGPLETKIIEEVKPPEDIAPPPPPPKVAPPPPPFIPMPDIQISVAPSANAIREVSVAKAPPPPVAPTQRVEIPPTPARIDVKSGCRMPEYPPAAKRAEEQGTVVVAFLVGADGRVKESKIASSSGSARLDEAARAALAACRFTPATVEGKPVADDTWTQTKYVWKLEDEQ